MNSSELPKLFKEKFLSAIQKNPNLDAKKLFNRITNDHKKAEKEEALKIQKKQRPFDDDNVNDAFEKASELGDSAANEFKKVFKLLGSKLSSDEILKKLEDKFEDKSVSFSAFELENLESALNRSNVNKILLELQNLGYTIKKTGYSTGYFFRPKRSKLIDYSSGYDLFKAVEDEL